MHLDFNITIRFLDVFIIGYMAYMYWIGTKQGAIVRAIDLFAFSGGILLSSLFTIKAYRYFSKNNAAHPELFAALLLTILFAASLWFSYSIQKTVYNQTKNLDKSKKNEFIGGGLSLIKAIIVSGIFTIILLSLNLSGKFLPKDEPKSAFGYITSSIVALTIRNLSPLYTTIYKSIGKKPVKRKNNIITQNQQQQNQIPVIKKTKPNNNF